MPGRQRILVVGTQASEAELQHLKGDVGRHPVVLAAPTAEALHVVRALEVEPQVEVLLAPVSHPQVDRGHQLDAFVRSHALHDRFRDVVVVTDQATSTLLLRALAPDQLASGGAATVVGLPRGDRPVVVRRAVALGLALGAAASATGSVTPLTLLPVVVAVLGLALMLVQHLRHVGRELLIASGIALTVVFVVVTGSARFPGGW